MVNPQGTLVLHVILAVITSAGSSVSYAALNHKTLKLNPTLILLGSVEGKLYFVEKTFKLQWPNATENCATQGLAPATIQTLAQRNFLRSKYSVLGRNDFWTAGRDAINFDQFVWDQAGKVESGLIFYSPNIPAQTCLVYKAWSEVEQYYHGRLCSDSNYFLCQTD